MYAFTPALQQAWQAFYEVFLDCWPGSVPLAPRCSWSHAHSDLGQPSLLFGHTCGYPLTHALAGQVLPFCVPQFDAPGCSGRLYSSQFIVHRDSTVSQLSDCRGKTAACNNVDSNSGMNVLRYAVAPLAGSGAFFKEVRMTGGHLASMQSVARGETDIAAIDAVSYQLALDAFPDLQGQLRSIGLSQATTTLPLVYPAGNRNFDSQLCLETLRQSLNQCPLEVKRRLRLSSFQPVSLADYQSITDIEQAAIEMGYPELK